MILSIAGNIHFPAVIVNLCFYSFRSITYNSSFHDKTYNIFFYQFTLYKALKFTRLKGVSESEPKKKQYKKRCDEITGFYDIDD